jgi:hypothetical protein
MTLCILCFHSEEDHRASATFLGLPCRKCGCDNFVEPPARFDRSAGLRYTFVMPNQGNLTVNGVVVAQLHTGDEVVLFCESTEEVKDDRL